jgi:DNA-binding response OmpR family regulator
MLGRKIFIAEDDPAIIDILRIRLELAGFQAFYAKTGRAAIDGIHQCKPDAVLLDIGLPIYDGFEVLRTIRASPATSKTPAMMLTARHHSADVQRALLLGAQDFVTKPFNDQKLIARVNRLVEKKAPKQEDEWAV